MKSLFCSSLPPLPKAAAWEHSAASHHARVLTMPAGALDRFLEPAIRLFSEKERWETGTELSFSALLFAGDHEIARCSRVSAYPQAVTAQMVRNFLNGGACQNVLSDRNARSLTVVNVGVADADLAGMDDHDPKALGSHPVFYRNRHISTLLNARTNIPSTQSEIPSGSDPHPDFSGGCRDPRYQSSLGPEACTAAFEAGRSAAAEIIDRESPAALVLGEMGIGNTTASAALAEITLGAEPATLVGKGTGVDTTGLKVKADAVRAIHKRIGKLRNLAGQITAYQGIPPILSEVGGFEHAALAGAAYEAARRQTHILLDGLIVTSSVHALCAADDDSALTPWLLAGHCGSEPAHVALLNNLSLRPLLSLDLRLGEGSGAMIAAGLIADAGQVLRRMATFTSAGIATRTSANSGC
jgi:nicotinate-nucleotide--dimethylbenzimidazole phosphoribosyltransferase